MLKSTLPILLVLFSLVSSISKSNASIFKNESDTITMELSEYNNIIVEGILNGKDTLKLMLHTAINDASLTTEASSRLSSIKFSSADSVESWGGQSESRYSKSNALEIGPYAWEDLGIWESKHSGHHTDGKFGLNLFEEKIVELNFENNYLVVHSNLPSQIDDYAQIRVDDEHGAMFIEGACLIGEEALNNKFLVHSGYSGAILLDDEFVAKNNIAEKLVKTDESILKDSYGNELKTINAILPGFKLGETEFKDLPIGFFEGSIKRQKMSVMGGDLLKRFNVIYDPNASMIYLKPNQLFASSYFVK